MNGAQSAKAKVGSISAQCMYTAVQPNESKDSCDLLVTYYKANGRLLALRFE